MRISEKIKITNDMVVKFSELSGDKNPIHLNEEYAKNTKFGRRIVHGLLLSSFFSRLISDKYPGEGSIYITQNLNFKKPCFIDDMVEVIIELDKNEGNKFFLKTLIYRDNDVLIDGNALVLNYKTNLKSHET